MVLGAAFSSTNTKQTAVQLQQSAVLCVLRMLAPGLCLSIHTKPLGLNCSSVKVVLAIACPGLGQQRGCGGLQASGA